MVAQVLNTYRLGEGGIVEVLGIHGGDSGVVGILLLIGY